MGFGLAVEHKMVEMIDAVYYPSFTFHHVLYHSMPTENYEQVELRSKFLS